MLTGWQEKAIFIVYRPKPINLLNRNSPTETLPLVFRYIKRNIRREKSMLDDVEARWINEYKHLSLSPLLFTREYLRHRDYFLEGCMEPIPLVYEGDTCRRIMNEPYEERIRLLVVSTILVERVRRFNGLQECINLDYITEEEATDKAMIMMQCDWKRGMPIEMIDHLLGQLEDRGIHLPEGWRDMP